MANKFFKTGLTQRQYAAQLGVSLSTVARWLRLTQAKRQANALPTKFLEVDVHGNAMAGSNAVYQIELPDGVRVRAKGAWQVERIGQLLDLLRGS